VKTHHNAWYYSGSRTGLELIVVGGGLRLSSEGKKKTKASKGEENDNPPGLKYSSFYGGI